MYAFVGKEGSSFGVFASGLSSSEATSTSVGKDSNLLRSIASGGAALGMCEAFRDLNMLPIRRLWRILYIRKTTQTTINVPAAHVNVNSFTTSRKRTERACRDEQALVCRRHCRHSLVCNCIVLRRERACNCCQWIGLRRVGCGRELQRHSYKRSVPGVRNDKRTTDNIVDINRMRWESFRSNRRQCLHQTTRRLCLRRRLLCCFRNPSASAISGCRFRPLVLEGSIPVTLEVLKGETSSSLR